MWTWNKRKFQRSDFIYTLTIPLLLWNWISIQSNIWYMLCTKVFIKLLKTIYIEWGPNKIIYLLLCFSCVSFKIYNLLNWWRSWSLHLAGMFSALKNNLTLHYRPVYCICLWRTFSLQYCAGSFFFLIKILCRVILKRMEDFLCNSSKLITCAISVSSSRQDPIFPG